MEFVSNLSKNMRIATLALALSNPLIASAGEKIALVFHNAKYESDHIIEDNANDVNLLLRKDGFQVTYLNNPKKQQVLDELDVFAKTADFDDTFILYGGGHGYQSSNESNLLLDRSTLSSSELEKKAKEIHAGREVYFIPSCEGGKFANVAKRNGEYAITGSSVGKTGAIGKDNATYIIEHLLDAGGFTSSSSTFEKDLQAAVALNTKNPSLKGTQVVSYQGKMSEHPDYYNAPNQQEDSAEDNLKRMREKLRKLREKQR